MECDIMGDAHLLPEKIWSSEKPLSWNFPTKEDFIEFHTEIERVTKFSSEKHPYNSFTSFARFYRKFKAQDLSLKEFYDNEYIASIDEDSLCCIGLILHLRRNLLKHLSNKFPYLESHLYFGTGNMYPFSEIPERSLDQPPNHTGQNKEHSMLLFKFTLETGRKGFIVFDFGFQICFPVVVMSDELWPHTGPFLVKSRFGRKTYNFKYNSEKYIHFVEIDLKNESELETKNRWFFVGKPLINPREVEKRNKVYSYHAYYVLNESGLITGFYHAMGKNEEISLMTTNPEDGDNLIKTTIVPMSYFESDDNKDDDIESILEDIARRRGNQLHQIKSILFDYAQIIRDEKFVNELLVIDEEMLRILEAM